MKIFIIVFLFISLANALYTTIVPGVKSTKKILPGKKTGCCLLSTNQLENVRLTKLCQMQHSTVIYMHLENTANACSYLDKISMVDNQGKSYKPISINGIPNCPNTSLIKSQIPFYWEFEKINKGVKSILLQEDENSVAPQPGIWNWWRWENIDISHCNL